MRKIKPLAIKKKYFISIGYEEKNGVWQSTIYNKLLTAFNIPKVISNAVKPNYAFKFKNVMAAKAAENDE